MRGDHQNTVTGDSKNKHTVIIITKATPKKVREGLKADLEIIILNKVSQKEKNKYHTISHTWSLKYNPGMSSS